MKVDIQVTTVLDSTRPKVGTILVTSAPVAPLALAYNTQYIVSLEGMEVVVKSTGIIEDRIASFEGVFRYINAVKAAAGSISRNAGLRSKARFTHMSLRVFSDLVADMFRRKTGTLRGSECFPARQFKLIDKYIVV